MTRKDTRKRLPRIRRPEYLFLLFVFHRSPTAAPACRALKSLCARHLGDRCQIQIIDVEEHSQAATDYDILATPTLLMRGPEGERRVVGSLDDTQQLLWALGISVADRP